jgi:excisionase family DNA binding protein
MQLLSAQQAAARLAVSRRTFFKLARQVGFPEPLRLSQRLVRYSEEDIERWLEEKRMKG